MRHQQVTTIVLIVAAIAAVYGSHSESAQPVEDQVLASFEREMRHVPAPAAAATRSSVDDDVLYDLISTPLQSD